MISLTDDMGRRFAFEAPPRRIVSLVPSLTETLIELGGADRVVGCTEWCVHPADATRNLPRVGVTKNVSVRRVLDLDPDLVVANREENRERHVRALEAEVPVFVAYPRTVPDALKTLRDMGTLVGAQARAAKIAEAAGALLASGRDSGVRYRAACLVWRDPWMVAAGDTYVSDLLAHTGFDNVFSETDARYPETTLEAILDRTPDVILLPDEPYAFGPADRDEVLAASGDRLARDRVVLLDGRHLTWHGFHTPVALRYLLALRGQVIP